MAKKSALTIRLEGDLEDLRTERQTLLKDIASLNSTVENLETRLSAATEMHTVACTRIAELERNVPENRGNADSQAQNPAVAAEGPQEGAYKRPDHFPASVVDINRTTYWKYVGFRRAKLRAQGARTIGYDSFEVWARKWTDILVPVQSTEEVAS